MSKQDDALATFKSFCDEARRKRDEARPKRTESPPMKVEILSADGAVYSPWPRHFMRNHLPIMSAIFAAEMDGDTSQLIQLLRTRNKYALADEGFLETVANALERKYKRASHRPAKRGQKSKDASIVAHLLFFSGAARLPIVGSDKREGEGLDTADLLAPLFHHTPSTLRKKWNNRDKALFDDARNELVRSAGREFASLYTVPFEADNLLAMLAGGTSP